MLPAGDQDTAPNQHLLLLQPGGTDARVPVGLLVVGNRRVLKCRWQLQDSAEVSHAAET